MGLESYLFRVLVRTGTFPGRNPADLEGPGLALCNTPPGTMRCRELCDISGLLASFS